MIYDLIITGAGAVGLATALQAQKQYPNWSVLLVDKAETVAAHQTGHNSGVIHSGVYYTPGSARARLCIQGYHQLLEFCDKEGVPYRITGKFIVAVSEDEIPRLRHIQQKGTANGLQGLQWMSGDEMREHSPTTGGIAALWVPQAGIVDYSAVCQAYARRILSNGGLIQLNTVVLGQSKNNREEIFEVATSKGDFHARHLVNCAGLYADKISALSGMPTQVQTLPFRGEYYELRPSVAAKVKHLIYPVPDPNFPFLGVHITPTIKGRVEVGPNAVLAFAREGYDNQTINVSELMEVFRYKGFQSMASKHWRKGAGELYRSFSRKAFFKAIQPLMPSLQIEDLVPGGAGVRAMAVYKNGEMADDFLIEQQGPLLNVVNAPSPAATASLAIGETIAGMIQSQE